MELTLDPEIENFRRDIRTFVQAAVPAEMARRTRHRIHPARKDLKEWNRILDEKGWAAPHWPVEYGGTGWSPLQIHIFEEECADADAPFLSYFGLRLVGPLIYTFGSERLKEKYLADIRSGQTFWCQGFSEPGSGSDLASVKTRAERVDGGWLINGQKLWTTEAHYADKMFCLARTNPDVRPQKGGLSIFLFDMTDPGVTVRPITTIDGGHTVNEVFIENVTVPDEEVLGEIGQGWDQAKFLLNNERVTNAHVPQSKRALTLIRQMAEDPAQGAPALHRADLREKLSRLEIDLMGLEWQVLRDLADGPSDARAAAASGMKIIGSHIQQRLSDLAVEIAGPRAMIALPDDLDQKNGIPGDTPPEFEGVGPRQLFRRAATIYAGSTEIQKEIISRQVFDL